jgi:hypothetical protein
MLGALIELVIIFVQSSRVFTQSLDWLAQLVEKLV